MYRQIQGQPMPIGLAADPAASPDIMTMTGGPASSPMVPGPGMGGVQDRSGILGRLQGTGGMIDQLIGMGQNPAMGHTWTAPQAQIGARPNFAGYLPSGFARMFAQFADSPMAQQLLGTPQAQRWMSRYGLTPEVVMSGTFDPNSLYTRDMAMADWRAGGTPQAPGVINGYQAPGTAPAPAPAPAPAAVDPALIGVAEAKAGRRRRDSR